MSPAVFENRTVPSVFGSLIKLFFVCFFFFLSCGMIVFHLYFGEQDTL